MLIDDVTDFFIFVQYEVQSKGGEDSTPGDDVIHGRSRGNIKGKMTTKLLSIETPQCQSSKNGHQDFVS